MPTIKELVREDKTVDIGMVLDESGTMESIKGQTIKSFNDFIKEQKQEGDDAHFTFVKFSTEPTMIQERVAISRAKEIGNETYSPNGITALYDAIYDTVKAIESKNKNNKVIIAIITDGYENASKRCNLPSLKEIITEKEKLGWKFLFLAANIDANKAASYMGITPMRPVAFAASADGISYAYAISSQSVTCYRSAVRAGTK